MDGVSLAALHVKKTGKWSETSVFMIPDVMWLSKRELVNMWSIIVLDILVTRVGLLIIGINYKNIILKYLQVAH